MKSDNWIARLTFCSVNRHLVRWRMLLTMSSFMCIICWLHLFCGCSKCCIDAMFSLFVKKLWVKKFAQNLEQDSWKIPKSWKNMVICDEASGLVDRPRNKTPKPPMEEPNMKISTNFKDKTRNIVDVVLLFRRQMSSLFLICSSKSASQTFFDFHNVCCAVIRSYSRRHRICNMEVPFHT
jgi:hypothetical protein